MSLCMLYSDESLNILYTGKNNIVLQDMYSVTCCSETYFTVGMLAVFTRILTENDMSKKYS